MVWIPDGEKISKISLFVLAQLTNVTDRQTPGDSKDRAYASHRAVKTTGFGENLDILVHLVGTSRSALMSCEQLNHRLRGSASTVNGDRPSQREMANFDPSENRNP